MAAKQHEYWNPGWAWLGIAILVIAFVAIFDIHASIAGTETMSGRMRDWIFDEVIGPFIVGAWIAVFAGLMWHFFTRNVSNK